MAENPGSGAGEDPRVRFAAERTLLAWVRTGLALMGFGFVVARFGLFLREMAAAQVPVPLSSGLSLWIGTVLVLLGVTVNVLATIEHAAVLRRIARRDKYQPPRYSLGIVVSLLLAAIGLAMTGYLLSMRP